MLTRKGELESDDLVLLKQRKGNKLSTTFGDVPYTVSKKHGNEGYNIISWRSQSAERYVGC